MSDISNQDPFKLPPRVTFGTELGAILHAKVSEVAADTSYNDSQKAFIASALSFDAKPRVFCPLSLLEADSFSVVSVSVHDSGADYSNDHVSIDHEEDVGNYAVRLWLRRDGSPFAYDEDVEEYGDDIGYTVLAGLDGAPTMVHNVRLLDAACMDPDFSTDNMDGTYRPYLGRWRDMSAVARTMGNQFLHMLSDTDCEHLLSAVAATEVDADGLVRSMVSVPGFNEL